MSLPPNFPQAAPVCRADLPTAQEAVRWDPARSTLRDVLMQFERGLARYQEFWDVLDEVDARCQVLEPENPTRGATLRRISLGSHCSVQIEVDPDHPRAMPELRFMGSDTKTAPLKRLLNKNMRRWNQQAGLPVNLEALLELPLPAKEKTAPEQAQAECGICYSHTLDGQLPSKSCDNPKCNQPFHSVCLIEWLRTLPNTRQSFNTLFGTCPYCSEALSIITH